MPDATDLTLIQPNAEGEVELIDPETGERHLLSTATDGELAAFKQHLSEWRMRAAEAERFADRELISRMDKLGTWTIHVGKVTLESSSPAPRRTIDNPAALRKALLALAREGVIAHEAVNAATPLPPPVKQPVKALLGKLDQLRKLGGQVAETIDEHTSEQDLSARRSVRVKGASGG
jgi:hypothetical protein